MKNYLESVQKQFEYYKMLGNKTFAQLDEEELFFAPNKTSNSIAIMVKHLWGNMLSRWTNFMTEDGEKEWRKRDEEFEATIQNKEELLDKWEEGWKCLFDALEAINEDNWDQLIYIRNQGHTITEAINRQLAHYSFHVGQIVYLGRLIKNEQWTSLSIPKGESKTYNQEKFSQKKKRGHFTDEYLADPKQ
jgi:hypothetical protein